MPHPVYANSGGLDGAIEPSCYKNTQSLFSSLKSSRKCASIYPVYLYLLCLKRC